MPSVLAPIVADHRRARGAIANKLDAWCLAAARKVDALVRQDLASGLDDAAGLAKVHALIEAEECPWVTDRRRWPTVFRSAAFGQQVRETHLRLFPGEERQAAIAVVGLMILRQVTVVQVVISDRESSNVSPIPRTPSP